MSRSKLTVVLFSAGVLACGGDDGGGSGTTGTSSTEDAGTGGGTDGATSTGASTTAGNDSGTSADGGEAGTGGGGDCGNAMHQLLPSDSPWNTRVDTASLDAESDAIIGYLQANVTGGARFQIDFSIAVLEADDTVEHQAFNPTSDHYSPDCDTAPVPVPDGGHIEGESGYTCDGDGDCHLIVVDRDECRLFEMWRASYRGPGDFDGGCLAIWDLETSYPQTLRGDYCTSADAAGLPIAALLFTADEIAAGEIPHAIRFIVPNANIRDDIYVRPGTHSTGATSGSADAPPYSARLRLKSDADISGLDAAAQVVARAMQTHGIILSDAGNVTFTAASDDFTAAKWSDVGLGPHDLKGLEWSDFEVVELGDRISWSSGSCSRTPVDG